MATAAEARYCEVVYELAEDDLDAVKARIAERLGVSRPAVSEMIERLARSGLVVVDGRQVRLTAQGSQLAEAAVRRHRLAERFLVDVLGLGWAEAHELAQKWQDVIDERSEPAFVRLLGDRSTCPHGNPIPGRDVPSNGAIPLSHFGIGDRGQVVRVTEQLEVEAGMLTTLERSGLIPGTSVEVLSIASDGALAVRASRGVLALSAASAACILALPGDLDAIANRMTRDRH